MVKTSTMMLALVSAVLKCSSSVDVALHEAFEEGLHLLQLKASSSRAQSASNATAMNEPGAAERQQCPHEIEEEIELEGDTPFGCEGGLRADTTVQCSMWGEPHITATFPSPRGAFAARFGIDVFLMAGLYRMASAADGTWEVQIFNCGQYTTAMAARFGKDIIEVLVNRQGDLEYYVNGVQTSTPSQNGPIYLDSTHRHIVTDMFDTNRRPLGQPGSCIDHPNGQIMIDLVQSKPKPTGPNGEYHYSEGNNKHNLNLHIVAASDVVTTKDTDGNALCNKAAGGPWKIDLQNWGIQKLSDGESLFVSAGPRACEGCELLGWQANPEDRNCHTPEGSVSEMRLDRVCAAQNPPIAIADAENACRALQDTPNFFWDCQLDYCFSGGEIVMAAAAQGEAAAENPQPICTGAAGACDPAGLCCNALRDQSTLKLDNVVQNNMCGSNGGEQEIRFGRALTQNGVDVDLVVTPVGDYDCGRVTNEKFGSKNVQIGLLAVQASTEATFKFEFVRSGTAELIAPQSLMISILDIDQGKKDKQRESVEMCGGGGAIVTDDSELEVTTSGDCTTVTSTTHGTGDDNPTSVEGMSQMQRARTAAFPVTGSSFTAKLGVSKKGHNPRRFMFTGHPSVSCVLK